MSNRQLMQATKLSQRVAEYVAQKIRGQEYDTSKIALLVQVTCTNPFEIADLYHFVRVKDYTSLLQLVRMRVNPQITLQSLKGAYLNLKDWNFDSRLNPQTNELEFDIVINDFEVMGGMGTVEQSENPVSLLEAPSVRSQLFRLKKYYIAQRFNSEHPFDISPIDNARFQQSERIRKGTTNIQRSYESTAALEDPFLIYQPPNDGRKSVSHLSQISDLDGEALSITGNVPATLFEQLRNKAAQRLYSTAPVQNPFELDLGTFGNEPLIPIQEVQDSIPANNPVLEEEHHEKLPNFGGEKAPETREIVEEEAERPQRRNFSDLTKESHETIIQFQQQELKKIKQGWGVGYEEKQKDLIRYRAKRQLETKHPDDDMMKYLLASSQSQEKEPEVVNQEMDLEYHAQQEVQARPPETKLSHMFEESYRVSDEDIEDSEKLPKIQTKHRGTASQEKSGRGLVEKMMNKPQSTETSDVSRKTYSFGQDNIRPKPEGQTLPPQTKREPQSSGKKVQSHLDDFVEAVVAIKEGKTLPKQPQQPRIKKKSEDKGAQEGYHKKPALEDAAVQTSQGIYQPQLQHQPQTYRQVRVQQENLIDLTSSEDRMQQSTIEIPLTEDYFRSFAEATGIKKESDKRHLYVENPLRQNSQIKLSDFKPARPKPIPRATSSTLGDIVPMTESTVIQRQPIKKSPASKIFNAKDFEILRKMYEESVSTNKKLGH